MSVCMPNASWYPDWDAAAETVNFPTMSSSQPKAAIGLSEPANLFRLLDQYQIEATLIRTENPAAKLLDHVDGWQKVYSDDIATIHVRKADAAHTVEPAVDAKVK